ncbi:hypothetical protein [Ramlibacter albus]|uniref:Uncharacterized protein n=1 Tax=Ramlibacter albus TaxID=2079448 RepID=A0A923M8U7_9BURK|nr:hypothetical protein [Ramlibacter albus]MBC5764642.1 hypothetical protein [Ramlibacter albus]
MFDKLRKAFSRDAGKRDAVEGTPSQPASQLQFTVSQWAQSHGFAVQMTGSGNTVKMQGKVHGKPWLMEAGTPTRNYIMGDELRARAEIGVNEDAAVLVINRPLKEALEAKAYNMITDDLQTTADPNLPEEMRWLAMYDEVGWDSLPMDFWNRYAILTDRRENALAWIDPQLAEMMLEWPEPGPSKDVPFMLLVLRGKAYMRMEYTPPTAQVLEHAAQIFTSACESAIGGLSVN